MGTLQKGKAIYRVRELKSPIHQEFRGLRVEVALPNMAGLKPFSDIPIPSFDKPYRVCMFGDYESYEYLTHKWPSIWRALCRMGFTEVEQIKSEDYQEEGTERRQETEGEELDDPDHIMGAPT